MSTGFLFWLLMILWLLFGLWVAWPYGPGPVDYRPMGGSLLLFVLLGLLGWKAFGPPLRNG